MGKMGKGEGKGAAAVGFDEATLETYKECFKLMDIDKDGVINKTDLRAAFDNVGRLAMDDELNSMLSEVGGPCNYDNMIKMFEAKMAGGVNDPDELVVNAFKAFDMEEEEKKEEEAASAEGGEEGATKKKKKKKKAAK